MLSNKHEQILQMAQDEQVEVMRCPLPAPLLTVYVRGGDAPLIALDSRLTTAEATCGCAEALGHHHTGGGNLLREDPAEAGRQRARALRWAHRQLLPLQALARAYLAFDGNPFAMAEDLEVTPAFLDSAVNHYRQKYGLGVDVDGFRITFIPAFVVERTGE